MASALLSAMKEFSGPQTLFSPPVTSPKIQPPGPNGAAPSTINRRSP